MIQVDINYDNDEHITRVLMHHAPCIGDVIWLQPRREQSAFKVNQVCHWVSDAAEFKDTAYHHVCIYVESIDA